MARTNKVAYGQEAIRLAADPKGLGMTSPRRFEKLRRVEVLEADKHDPGYPWTEIVAYGHRNEELARKRMTR